MNCIRLRGWIGNAREEALFSNHISEMGKVCFPGNLSKVVSGHDAPLPIEHRSISLHKTNDWKQVDDADRPFNMV